MLFLLGDFLVIKRSKRVAKSEDDSVEHVAGGVAENAMQPINVNKSYPRRFDESWRGNPILILFEGSLKERPRCILGKDVVGNF